MLCDYLVQILTARVYDVAQETPLEYTPNLSARLNNKLLLKREDMQSVFSFKLRGAYNKMAQLPTDRAIALQLDCLTTTCLRHRFNKCPKRIIY
jgi:threonine dehydratase